MPCLPLSLTVVSFISMVKISIYINFMSHFGRASFETGSQFWTPWNNNINNNKIHCLNLHVLSQLKNIAQFRFLKTIYNKLWLEGYYVISSASLFLKKETKINTNVTWNDINCTYTAWPNTLPVTPPCLILGFSNFQFLIWNFRTLIMKIVSI